MHLLLKRLQSYFLKVTFSSKKDIHKCNDVSNSYSWDCELGIAIVKLL